MNVPLVLPLAQLRPALTGLGKIVNKRSPLAVLNQVRIQRHADGTTELTVTDLDRAATCRLTGRAGGAPLTLLVPLEDLSNVTRSTAGSETIEVEPLDDQTTLLRFRMGGQSIEHRCDTLPPTDFPEMPRCEGEAIPVPDSLRAAFCDAMTCAGGDATRRIHSGVCLDVSKPDAHYVVASDGRHLFSANSFHLPLEHSLIVPDHKFLRWRGFVEDGAWRLRAGSLPKQSTPLIELAGERWRFVTRGIDGSYPNWRHVLPDPNAFTASVSLDPQKLGSLLRVVQGLPVPPDDKQLVIGLEVKDHQFRLLSRARMDQEWTRTEVEDATASGSDLTVLVNRNYVLKAIRLGLTRIDLCDERSPLRFSLGGRQMIAIPARPSQLPPPAAPAAPATAAASGSNIPNPHPTDPPMPQSTSHPTPPSPASSPRINGHATPPQPAAAEVTKPALETALEQTDQLRASTRSLLAGLTRLGDTLRQVAREQRAGDKDLQTLRHTLRSLQNVRI